MWGLRRGGGPRMRTRVRRLLFDCQVCLRLHHHRQLLLHRRRHQHCTGHIHLSHQHRVISTPRPSTGFIFTFCSSIGIISTPRPSIGIISTPCPSWSCLTPPPAPHWQPGPEHQLPFVSRGWKTAQLSQICFSWDAFKLTN